MDETQIMAQLTEILRDVLEEPDLAVVAQTSATSVPAWDSMKHILILMAVQDRFGIRLSTREIDQLRNVGDLAAVIAHHSSKRTPV
jgi:acyl carrier protein